LGKAAFVTPVYLSIAWTLMISYQLFTETAVKTVMREVNVLWPQIGTWLNSRIDMVVFIYAFSWVFVLSSVIPFLILGRERGVFVQFVMVLILTFTAFVIQDALVIYFGVQVDQIFSLVVFFQNPLIATLFLFAPYVLMLLIDLRGRAKRHRKNVQEGEKFKMTFKEMNEERCT
jgi:hypothetical protein